MAASANPFGIEFSFRWFFNFVMGRIRAYSNPKLSQDCEKQTASLTHLFSTMDSNKFAGQFGSLRDETSVLRTTSQEVSSNHGNKKSTMQAYVKNSENLQIKLIGQVESLLADRVYSDECKKFADALPLGPLRDYYLGFLELRQVQDQIAQEGYTEHTEIPADLLIKYQHARNKIERARGNPCKLSEAGERINDPYHVANRSSADITREHAFVRACYMLDVGEYSYFPEHPTRDEQSKRLKAAKTLLMGKEFDQYNPALHRLGQVDMGLYHVSVQNFLDRDTGRSAQPPSNSFAGTGMQIEFNLATTEGKSYLPAQLFIARQLISYYMRCSKNQDALADHSQFSLFEYAKGEARTSHLSNCHRAMQLLSQAALDGQPDALDSMVSLVAHVKENELSEEYAFLSDIVDSLHEPIQDETLRSFNPFSTEEQRLQFRQFMEQHLNKKEAWYKAHPNRYNVEYNLNRINVVRRALNMQAEEPISFVAKNPEPSTHTNAPVATTGKTFDNTTSGSENPFDDLDFDDSDMQALGLSFKSEVAEHNADWLKNIADKLETSDEDTENDSARVELLKKLEDELDNLIDEVNRSVRSQSTIPTAGP